MKSLKFSLLSVVFVVVGFGAGTSHALIQPTSVVDPFENLPTGQTLDVFSRERAVHYIGVVIENEVLHGVPNEKQVERALELTKKMGARFNRHSSAEPLSLLNTLLFELAKQYRYRSPLREAGITEDPVEHQEMRQLTLSAAKIVLKTIAKLKPERVSVDVEFYGQKSHATPLEVLVSYRPREATKDLEARKFFGGELDLDLEKEISLLKKAERMLPRVMGRVKSCLLVF